MQTPNGLCCDLPCCALTYCNYSSRKSNGEHVLPLVTRGSLCRGVWSLMNSRPYLFKGWSYSVVWFPFNNHCSSFIPLFKRITEKKLWISFWCSCSLGAWATIKLWPLSFCTGSTVWETAGLPIPNFSFFLCLFIYLLLLITYPLMLSLQTACRKQLL